MIYGDNPQDPLGLNVYTPDMAAIMQSSNLYVYCGNNPLMYVDPTGEAWYHWVIGGLVVVAAAAAVVVTAGGALPAVMAVGSVAGGTAAATTATTIAAGAFIGSSIVYGGMVLYAVDNSKSLGDFNAQGNWGTVAFTAGGAIAGMAYAGTLTKQNAPAPTLKSKTARNFRYNLQQVSGSNGTGMQAHHVLPQKFESFFSKAGLNINDPMFGSWVGSNHQSWSNAYNKAWETFFNTVKNPTAAQILGKAAELAKEYGFEIGFN